MSHRLSVAVGYAGGAVNVEIDLSYVTDKRPVDYGTGWINDDGSFASPPDVDRAALQRRADRVKKAAARNMRTRELSGAVRNADLSIEDWERVAEDPHGVRNVVRIWPDGKGASRPVRYRVTRDGSLEEL